MGCQSTKLTKPRTKLIKPRTLGAKWRPSGARPKGHTQKVLSVAFHPTNPTLLATGSMDGTVRIWNFATAECIKTLEGHAGGVYSVAFHPKNPALLATGNYDNIAKIWNIDAEECIKTLEGHAGGVNSVAFHATNPTLLATGSSDNTAKIWNIDTGECTKTLEGHTSYVFSVDFHPTNPTLLATGSHDNTARIWNFDTGECTKTLKGHKSYVRSVAFHPTNPTLLATGSYFDKTAKIWNIDTGACTKTLEGHTHLGVRANPYVTSVAFHPTNPSLLATTGDNMSAADDCTAKIWNIDAEVCIKTLHGPKHCVAFHPTHPTVLATGSGGWGDNHTARTWNVGDNAQFNQLQRKFESEFGAAHPIVVKTHAGEAYTLEDWGLCKDLKAAVSELAPETLGEPDTFELLGNLGDRNEEGGGTAQIDGTYGSHDRQRMLVQSCGFNFELMLVHSISAGNHANLESRDVPPMPRSQPLQAEYGGLQRQEPSTAATRNHYGGAILKQHSFV